MEIERSGAVQGYRESEASIHRRERGRGRPWCRLSLGVDRTAVDAPVTRHGVVVETQGQQGACFSAAVHVPFIDFIR